MRFQNALQSHAAQLTEADRRIANCLLSASSGFSGLTAGQLAAQADVHESTVVRFAQKLGYEGYPELRAELVAEFTQLSAHVNAADSRREPSLSAVVRSQIELLRDLPRLVPQTSIDAAAASLATAERVLVLGRGMMMPAASFMTRKLGLVGIVATHASQGLGEAVELAALLRPGDVVLVFAFHDEYATYGQLVSALSRDGVRGVLVSDQEALFASNLPDVVLPVPRHYADLGIVGAIIAIAYALEYSLSTIAQRPSIRQRISDLGRLAQLPNLEARLDRIQEHQQ